MTLPNPKLTYAEQIEALGWPMSMERHAPLLKAIASSADVALAARDLEIEKSAEYSRIAAKFAREEAGTLDSFGMIASAAKLRAIADIIDAARAALNPVEVNP